MRYSSLFNRNRTTQGRASKLVGQMFNAAGGYAWPVDRWMRLDRFLILGSESGTYYIGEHKLTLEHADNVITLVREDGVRVVDRITEISQSGRAPKNDPAVFALALAASLGNEETRAAAFRALPLVCRTGTHLFVFADACKGLRGWGRGMRKAVGRWYNAQTPEDLTYGLIKYQTREGWSNRDLLRLAHPKPSTEAHGVLYKWAVDAEMTGEAPLLAAMLRLRAETNVQVAAALIREYRIPREAVPSELLNESDIWNALLVNMPSTALLRNLGNLTRVGATTGVVERLSKLKRVHPVAVLGAMVTYASGRGVLGKHTWTPLPAIVDALNDAFYRSFDSVDSTGKRYVLALDVSGSMAGTRVAEMAGLDCRKATGAMALVTKAREAEVATLAFDTDVYPLALSERQRLDDVVHVLERTGGGGTDCAAPIRYAMQRQIPADVIVIYTDSETWQGAQHPAQAMKAYRKGMGIPTKLVVVAMASNRVSIADPQDALTLNVVGFDTTVPQVVAEFVRS